MRPGYWRCARGRSGWFLVLLVFAGGSGGCASVTRDVRDYYQQMAYNYKEAADKARLKAATLEGESKMELATGDLTHYRRSKRELKKIKAWEEKCIKQEERFAKAARWTEDKFGIARGGPGYDKMFGDAGAERASEPDSVSPGLSAAAGSSVSATR